jgi:hypothetical protein
MIKQFLSKKLELVPFLDHNSEDVTFLDMAFNRFGALTKIFTNQGINFCGNSKSCVIKHKLITTSLHETFVR